jgi:hypothetical protein
MANSKKKAAVKTLKLEITRMQSKMKRAMRRASLTGSQRKRLRLAMQRLDKAYKGVSMAFDDKACLGFDDVNCVFND